MKNYKRLVMVCFVLVAFDASPVGAVTISFRQGLSGYTQAQDTWLTKASPNSNWGTNTGIGVGRLGAPNEEQALLGFYNIFGNGVGQIPLGSTINSATLSVFNSSVTVPANAAAHRMLVPWTDTVATWNNLSNGLDSPGVEYVAVPGYSGSFGASTVSITPIVQDWSNGAANYGVGLIPTTSTGSFAFQSAEFAGTNSRPILTVDYVGVPEPTAVLLAVVGGALLCSLRRPRLTV